MRGGREHGGSIGLGSKPDSHYGPIVASAPEHAMVAIGPPVMAARKRSEIVTRVSVRRAQVASTRGSRRVASPGRQSPGYSRRNDRAAIARQTTSQTVRIARSSPSGAVRARRPGARRAHARRRPRAPTPDHEGRSRRPSQARRPSRSATSPAGSQKRSPCGARAEAGCKACTRLLV